MMELELGLQALPVDPGPKKADSPRSLGVLLDSKASVGTGSKRRATLSLFVRGGGDERRRGGDDDDDDDRDEATDNKRKRLLVGWPPVKRAHVRRGGGGAGYVKVRMEGVAIGRNLDVSRHGSYDELLRALDRMFPPPSAAAAKGDDDDAPGGPNDDQRRRCRRRHTFDVVTYEDAEGDWLLVGDVPWEAFAKSVKRLKILA